MCNFENLYLHFLAKKMCFLNLTKESFITKKYMETSQNLLYCNIQLNM